MGDKLLEEEALTFEQVVYEVGAFQFEEPMSRDFFMELAAHYPALRMERESDGKILIMSPVKRGTSKRESKLLGLLFLWYYATKMGELHGPNVGFDLPDGATRSPDAAWISPERLAMDDGDEESFARVVPDFIAEVRSSSDRLKPLQKKMTHTWLANGVRLAWLIDPYEEKAYLYRPDQEVEIVVGFAGKMLSGEGVLPGFELPLDEMRREVK
ncbi:MAG: Uma2 family endonuclease [Saprospiraceae bacterium]